MKYMVSGKERPQNHPIYLVHFDMDFFILYNDQCLEEDDENMENILEEIVGELQETKSKHDDDEEGLLNMDFDREVSK